MARIEFAPEVADDFDRILDHLDEYGIDDRSARIGEIIQAINALVFNPLIGRPVAPDMNELVIGRDARGYVALYGYVAAIDTVFMLAIRSRWEAGYARG